MLRHDGLAFNSSGSVRWRIASDIPIVLHSVLVLSSFLDI